MQIQCPGCGASGAMDETKIPDEGTSVSCPKCKNRFLVRRSAGASDPAVHVCPACQYGADPQNPFQICPKCGLVVEKFLKAQERKKVLEEEKVASELGIGVTPGIPKAEKPTAVKVIGWLFIAFAAFMVYSAVTYFIIFTVSLQMIMQQIPTKAAHKAVAFGYSVIIALLQVAFGTFVIFAGVQFLKLRAWARTALEAVSWLGLLCFVSLYIMWLINMSENSKVVPEIVQGSAQAKFWAQARFLLNGSAVGLVWLSVFAVPTIIVIKVLRGKPIRDAVRG